MASFDLPVSFCNQSAQPILIENARLRLRFPKLPIPDNYELLDAAWELKPEDAAKITKHRFDWLDELGPSDWMTFVVLPKATALKHLIFELRWDDPVIQPEILASLEIKSSAGGGWATVGEWKLHLSAPIWGELANNGTSMAYTPVGAQSPQERVNPPDLHKYTGSKDAIPPNGLTAAPSYLNYPNEDPAERGDP